MATTRATAAEGGIVVEGLDETIKAIARFSKEIRGEAIEVFRDEAKDVQRLAKTFATRAPAASSNTGWIGRSATGKGAGVKLNAGKNDRAWATEWGMDSWHYNDWGGHERETVQRAMSRRTFLPWRGSKFTVRPGPGPGHVIQQALRNLLPGMEERVAKRLQAVLVKALDRAGVPRG